MKEFSKSTLVEQLQSLVRNIVGALIEYKKQKKFTSEPYKHYDLKEKQRIRIEDLIQIFVDDIPQMKDFLQYVIETYGNQNEA